MKNKIMSVVCVAAFFGGTAFAATANQKLALKGESISDLNARTLLLEKELRSLQHKIAEMEKSKKTTPVRAVGKPASKYDTNSLLEFHVHGPAIVTSPALGVRRSAEDGSDLMVNLPSINEDLILLRVRKKMDDYARENNIPISERPIIALSGSVEGQISHTNDMINNVKQGDIDLTTAELDVVAEASPWVTAAMIAEYDNDEPLDRTYRRVNNSRLQVSRGWLTIGQLNKFPFYFSIGQMYAPFGSFSSDMISKPVTKALGRMKDRMAVVGYTQGGFNAQVFCYAGEISSRSIFNHGGLNLGYDYQQDKFKLSIGSSVIGNMAETDKMQTKIFGAYYDTGVPKNASKLNYPKAETTNNNVPAVDGRIKIAYLPFTLRAEYVGALKRFDSNDMSFNTNGAKPQAAHVEGAYEFNLLGKPSNFAVGYGHTWGALALGLPQNTLFAEYDVSVVKNTILSLEYRHDIDYAAGSSGLGKVGGTASQGGTGKHANIVTLALQAYF